MYSLYIIKTVKGNFNMLLFVREIKIEQSSQSSDGAMIEETDRFFDTSFKCQSWTGLVNYICLFCTAV